MDSFPEVRGGRLKRAVHLTSNALVSPLLLIESATYGLSASAKKERLHNLAKDIGRCDIIEHRSEMAELQNIPVGFQDVTSQLQRVADQQGGLSLVLEKGVFDPNAVFGNPLPGHRKILEANVLCPGHDSEARAESHEISRSGVPINFIMRKRERFLAAVVDDESGVGQLTESLQLETHNALPLLQIDRAMYECIDDKKKAFDVTSVMQSFVKGR
eukprot:gene3486-4331_t